MLASGLPAKTAQANPGPGRGSPRIAGDLNAEARRGGPPQAPWARDMGGVRYVQVIVVSQAKDPDLSDLRKFVLKSGGSVLARHDGIKALTVMVKADSLPALAQHKDVRSLSPNRVTARTASTLEQITGAAVSGPTGNVRTSSSKKDYQGLDGSGIGIAVLDSGVMKTHEAFVNGSGASRVVKSVSMLKSNLSLWATGLDGNTAPTQPGSNALSAYEQAIDASAALTLDPYGHGTHVAGVAAGRSKDYGRGTPESTGVAPGASIYDVRVLDNQGLGSVSDVLEAIQWVIYHAKEYNIRVMNLSLAADASESWQTDPLCLAVRNATAAGITVVVAAGNFGRTTSGQEAYGAISSPGHEPSVITVGAVNFKGTVGRADDSVNLFSARGPTRGAMLDANGQAVADNLLKPDLVAPGNKVVSAMATQASSTNPTWNYLATTYAASLVTPLDGKPAYPEGQMLLSGTSVAAPVVAGTVALMLQANPGLTRRR